MLHNGQIFGSYRIESLLGRGAMGVVYRGVGLCDDQPVAIKTVRSELLTGSERDAMLTRFRREADIGMRLRHPRIVRVRDYGEYEDILYLVMEFVTGQELGKLLESQPKLPLAMSLALILQLLNALAYAHNQGVIHRDIKPANILVRPDYTLILTDFGIAHVGGSELTQTGDLLGSPLYMAPEQLRGEPVDGRADLFAAGVVLYYLLTQRKPFTADTLAALMHRVLCEEPLPPSTINRALPATFDAVLRRALDKDRKARFSNALDFATALRQARIDAVESTIVMPADRLPKPAWPIAKASLERDEWLRLQQAWGGAALTPLAETILHDAPLPGRVLQNARGDWLDRVRLFAQLWEAGRRLGHEHAADMTRADLLQQLTGAFLDYAGTLNQLLFSEDNPQLLRISADFARLDLLRLALEELGADTEARRVQQAQILFASQVMGKVNSLIRQFIDRRGPLARFGVASLLVEVEELIVLADRLLEGSETAVAEAATPGGAVLAEFMDNAHRLSRILGQELLQQVQAELQRDGAAMTGSDLEQALFVGRLRQLGLLYRFATRMEDRERTEALRALATEMHRFLNRLTDRLLTGAANTEPPVINDQRWVRLSVIAELAEQFVWPELHQRILLAIRNQVLAVGSLDPIDKSPGLGNDSQVPLPDSKG